MKKEKENIVPSASDIVDSDFVFVQQDKTIHDQKFETKPTTFFKDAMKRFAKNKSSVVAAGILAAIILMAIIVPVADTNNIKDPVAGMRYLPPKWFDNANGFLDGTKVVSGVILDPNTGLPNESDYKSRAIVTNSEDPREAISVSSSYVDGISENILRYGANGSISLAVSGKEDGEEFIPNEAYFVSPDFTFSKGQSATLTYTLDKDYFNEKSHEDTELYASLVYVGDLDGDGVKEEYRLIEDSVLSETSAWNVNFPGDLGAEAAGKIAGATSEAFTGHLTISLSPKTLADSSNKMYIKSVEKTAGDIEFGGVLFNNAVAEVNKENNKETQGIAYKTEGGMIRSLAQVAVKTGSFRYDYYEAAFGVEAHFKISKKLLDRYISKGYINWDWEGKKTSKELVEFTADPSMYTINDTTHCPIVSIDTYVNRQTTLLGEKIIVQEVYVHVSLYRYYWEAGNLGVCAMPKFIFGTSQNGMDFFKIVFSGLLTSLGLGLLSAVINIFIGLIWGAISGYFGGWTDIVMERITEILGGMPWIVLMTLIVLLLGSGFWTLLLALCLTGWMGVAHVTRSQFYRFKGREYVLASRTLGASDARLIFKHILPNGIGTIVTGAVLMVPSVIFTEANIAYLLPGLLSYGSGTVSFGITLSDAQGYLTNYPYMIVSAFIVMILIMIAFNLFGNGLRDAFNPSLKGTDE